jgi:hypothetical protein
VYLTSRETHAGATFSYNAARKWNLSVGGGYSRLYGIGQNLQPYSQFVGGGGATYAITSPIHAFVRYDAHHQEISQGIYGQTGYRATIGLSFSPGDVPLAFH